MNRKHRRKNLLLLMVLVLGMLILTGCGRNTVETGAPVAAQQAEAEASIPADAEPEDTMPEETSQQENTETEPEAADTLVVCFSATGHTKTLAEYAADELGADIYEIIPEITYTDADLDYGDSDSRTSKEQNDETARPAISGELPDISGYDTIIIGHPIWWGQAPKIIYTFLESYDWSGKTLVTFCTSASSSLGTSAEDLKPSASGNPTWLESRRFPIGAGQDEVADWLHEILP